MSYYLHLAAYVVIVLGPAAATLGILHLWEKWEVARFRAELEKWDSLPFLQDQGAREDRQL